MRKIIIPSLTIYEDDKVKQQYVGHKLNNVMALMNPKLINVKL